MSDVKYSKEHEWIKLEGEVATIGITKHATEMLGDIVFTELPEKGSNVGVPSVLLFPLEKAVESNISEETSPIIGVKSITDAKCDEAKIISFDSCIKV